MTDAGGDRPATSDITRSAGNRPGPDSSQRPVLEAGHTFGSYRLVRRLGHGAFGVVWEAEQLETGRRLALKLLTGYRGASPDSIDRFAREGQLAAKLNHPRCVFVFGVEEIQGSPAVAMELMAGGSLQDELDRTGPLSPRAAVDYMLDIVDGLNAARAAGIVHRDIKPANCFLDSGGRVKIGDFGISKTLEPQGPPTEAGVFVGTPVYASPEQVRGHQVDFRSDIYSAGATLYALLSGHPPFRGSSAGEVMARVVSEPAAPLAGNGGKVPRALHRVVRRMMEKDAGRRFQDYESLQAALMPFSSHGLTPASLALRLVAYRFDLVLWTFIAFPVARRANLLILDITFATSLAALLAVPVIGYFALSEWYWGRTLGKSWSRLRVATTSGLPPSLAQTTGRIGFLLGTSVFAALAQSVGLAALAQVLPLVTMRRGNGYAGIHELLTGTRVMAVPRRVRRAVPAAVLSGAPDPMASTLIGPYRRRRVVWSTADEEVLIAYDEMLSREVWIHRYTQAVTVPAVSSLAEARTHRLRWLAGRHGADGGWDAFEAAAGIGLADWLNRRGTLTWGEALPVLSGVAMELAARAREGAPPGSFAVDDVWIDESGEPRLLEFRTALEADWPASTSGSMFLHHLAIRALDGRLVPESGLAGIHPAAPLPDHASAVVDLIVAAAPLPVVAEGLRGLADRPPRVTRARRLGPLLASLGIPALGPIGVAMTAVLLPLLVGATPFAQFLESSSVVRQLENPARRAQQLPVDEVVAHERIVAGTYERLKNTPLMLQLPRRDIERYERLVARYPSVSDDELDAAKALVARHPPAAPAVFSWSGLLVINAAFLRMFAFAALAAVLLGGLLKSPLLRVAGISVKTMDGNRATRARHLARAGLVVAPLLPFLLSSRPPMMIWLVPGVWLVLLVSTAFALARPARGLPDLIAGTCLVPR